MANLDFPRHCDDRIAAACRRLSARRLAMAVAGRQRTALRFRLAKSSMRQTRTGQSTHFSIGALRALWDTAGRATRRAGLTQTSQSVLSATDKLLDACRETSRLPSVDGSPLPSAISRLRRWGRLWTLRGSSRLFADGPRLHTVRSPLPGSSPVHPHAFSQNSSGSSDESPADEGERTLKRTRSVRPAVPHPVECSTSDVMEFKDRSKAKTHAAKLNGKD
jgi:hypothetical protein